MRSQILSKLFLLTGSLMFSASAFTTCRVVARSSRSRLCRPYYNHQRHHQQSRLFMNMFQDLFASPTVASPDDVRAAFAKPNVVVIDVRSPSEISTQVDAPRWINAPGTPFDCPALSEPSSTLPDDKSTPIIVYCASGKRSQKAMSILQEQGYANVWNAGGIQQVAEYLPIKNSK